MQSEKQKPHSRVQFSQFRLIIPSTIVPALIFLLQFPSDILNPALTWRIIITNSRNHLSQKSYNHFPSLSSNILHSRNYGAFSDFPVVTVAHLPPLRPDPWLISSPFRRSPRVHRRIDGFTAPCSFHSISPKVRCKRSAAFTAPTAITNDHSLVRQLLPAKTAGFSADLPSAEGRVSLSPLQMAVGCCRFKLNIQWRAPATAVVMRICRESLRDERNLRAR